MIDPARVIARAILGLALIALIASASGCSSAKEIEAPGIRKQFVMASTLNCRERASVDAPVTARLERGRSVEVSDSDGAWVKADVGGSTCWVASEHLVDEPPSSAEALAGSPPASPGGRYRHVTACPCTGTHLCTGPKGGRFCVTSGGYKEYFSR